MLEMFVHALEAELGLTENSDLAPIARMGYIMTEVIHLRRAAEQRNEAEPSGQICPLCRGKGFTHEYLRFPRKCKRCAGTGQI